MDASAIRLLHAKPVRACSFSSEYICRRTYAWAGIDRNSVDGSNFDKEREGSTAEQVWDAMQALLPLALNPVSASRDFSFDNLFIRDSEVTGRIGSGHLCSLLGSSNRAELPVQFSAAPQQRSLQQNCIPTRISTSCNLLAV